DGSRSRPPTRSLARSRPPTPSPTCSPPRSLSLPRPRAAEVASCRSAAPASPGASSRAACKSRSRPVVDGSAGSRSRAKASSACRKPVTLRAIAASVATAAATLAASASSSVPRPKSASRSSGTGGPCGVPRRRDSPASPFILGTSLLQRRAHLQERPAQLALHGTQRKPVPLGEFGVRPATEVRLLQELALAVPQARQRAAREDAGDRVVVVVRDDGEGGIVRIERYDGARPRRTRAQARQARVARDGEQVRADRGAVVLVPAGAPPQAQERVVKHLFGFLRAVQHAPRQREHDPAMAAIERRECLLAALR